MNPQMYANPPGVPPFEAGQGRPQISADDYSIPGEQIEAEEGPSWLSIITGGLLVAAAVGGGYYWYKSRQNKTAKTKTKKGKKKSTKGKTATTDSAAPKSAAPAAAGPSAAAPQPAAATKKATATPAGKGSTPASLEARRQAELKDTVEHKAPVTTSRGGAASTGSTPSTASTHVGPAQARRQAANAAVTDVAADGGNPEFIKILTDAIQRMQAGVVDHDKDSTIVAAIRFEDPSKYSTKIRLYAGQFLMVYHVYKQMQQTGESVDFSPLSLQTDEQTADSAIAWKWLDIPNIDGLPDEEAQSIQLLRSDLAQKLKDVRKLNEIVDTMLKSKAKLPMEGVMALLTMTLAAGRWKDSVEIAGGLEPQILPSLHAMAVQSSEVAPDYEAIVMLAINELRAGIERVPESETRWEQYIINDVAYKLINVSADESHAAAAEELKAIHGEDWGAVDIENIPFPQRRVLRLGAFCILSSTLQETMPLMGLISASRFTTLGYFEMPDNERKVFVQHTEAMTMTPTEEDLTWSGQCVVTERDVTPQQITTQNRHQLKPAMQAVYEVKVQLQHIDSREAELRMKAAVAEAKAGQPSEEEQQNMLRAFQEQAGRRRQAQQEAEQEEEPLSREDQEAQLEALAQAMQDPQFLAMLREQGGVMQGDDEPESPEHKPSGAEIEEVEEDVD